MKIEVEWLGGPPPDDLEHWLAVMRETFGHEQGVLRVQMQKRGEEWEVLSALQHQES